MSYGQLERDGEGFVLTRVPPHVRIALKAVFPRLPKLATEAFLFDGEPQTRADLKWFRERYPFACSLDVEAALERGREAVLRVRAEMERIKAPDWTPPQFAGLKPGEAVRPDQARAVEILNRFGGLLVADKVGAGKTYTTLAAALTEGNLPLVVVAPPHLSGQWVEKCNAFTSLRAHEVKVTKPYDLPEADVYVFRYTNVAGWIDILAEMRIGLDATPIYNWGHEIWTILSYLRPEVLGRLDDFLREWAADGRVADPRALGAFLEDQHAIVRRSGKDVPVRVSVVPVNHDTQALESVEAMAAALAEKARSGSWHERGEAVRELDLRVRRATGIAKAPFVAQLVDMLAAERGPVILAGWHRAVYDIWLERLAHLNPRLYTGTETPRQKALAIKAFLSGDSKVLIMSLRSGKGVDGLQAVSSTAVVGELDWSPATHAQFFGRVAREGQGADEVLGVFALADDGSDPPMAEVNGLKASEASAILDPSLAVTSGLIDDGSRMQSLVERYLKRRAA